MPAWHPLTIRLPFQLVRLPHIPGHGRIFLSRPVVASWIALYFPIRYIIPHRAQTLSHALQTGVKAWFFWPYRPPSGRRSLSVTQKGAALAST